MRLDTPHSRRDPRQAAAEEIQSGKGHFQCRNCGRAIAETAPGTCHRNHCPLCLWSVHVDIRIGDRLSSCGARMEPIAVWVQRNGEWSIVHRCKECGATRANRIAGDDNELALMSLAVRPLAMPPFPLDQLAGLSLEARFKAQGKNNR